METIDNLECFDDISHYTTGDVQPVYKCRTCERTYAVYEIVHTHGTLIQCDKPKTQYIEKYTDEMAVVVPDGYRVPVKICANCSEKEVKKKRAVKAVCTMCGNAGRFLPTKEGHCPVCVSNEINKIVEDEYKRNPPTKDKSGNIICAPFPSEVNAKISTLTTKLAAKQQVWMRVLIETTNTCPSNGKLVSVTLIESLDFNDPAKWSDIVTRWYNNDSLTDLDYWVGRESTRLTVVQHGTSENDMADAISNYIIEVCSNTNVSFDRSTSIEWKWIKWLLLKYNKKIVF